jgi:hypothetical protein
MFKNNTWEKKLPQGPNVQPNSALKARGETSKEARDKVYWAPTTKSACTSRGWPSKTFMEVQLQRSWGENSRNLPFGKKTTTTTRVPMHDHGVK